MIELRLSPRGSLEAGHQCGDDVRQRIDETGSRLDRMRQLTQLAVNGHHPRFDVPDAAEDEIPVLGPVEQLRKLRAEEPHLRGQRGETLEGAVVDVEAESHELSLARLDE